MNRFFYFAVLVAFFAAMIASALCEDDSKSKDSSNPMAGFMKMAGDTMKKMGEPMKSMFSK